MADDTEVQKYSGWFFDSDGTVQDDKSTPIGEVLSQGGLAPGTNLNHLFVFAHGWNNDQAAATDLFNVMFDLMAAEAATCKSDAATAGNPDPLGTIGFLGVYWPSIWFPDAPPGDQQVVQATQAGSPGAADAAFTGATIADSLTRSFSDPTDQASIATMGSLIDKGLENVNALSKDVQTANVAQFHQELRTVFGSSVGVGAGDDGEARLLTSDLDPTDLYQKFAVGMGSVQVVGDAQGLGNIFKKAWNGARDALRVASYLEMKHRAGTIGQHGLGPRLAQLHTESPATQIHLVGHSFGARLVSYSLNGIGAAEDSPVHSVTLIQGAFSHWAFAKKNNFGTMGALYGVRDRVHGPVLSTFTAKDWAVGVWYPKASILSGEDAQVAADQISRWGGMGSDGTQGDDLPLPPVDPTVMKPSQTHYGLAAGTYYRVDANGVIKEIQSAFSGAHSDIRHREVAWLPVCAAAGL